jgi:hypothetical protein
MGSVIAVCEKDRSSGQPGSHGFMKFGSSAESVGKLTEKGDFPSPANIR